MNERQKITKLFRGFYCALLLGPAVFGAGAIDAAAESAAPQPVDVVTSDGQTVCNPSAAFSQVPGHVDVFVGRVLGIGSADYCHQKHKNVMPSLALYRMDWKSHTLTMLHFLVQLPAKTPTGVDLRAAYDPYVVAYNGDIWVAFECTVPGAVSSCVAPLSTDLSTLNLSKLSVPAKGILGPHGPKGQIVGLLSASAPTLMVYDNKLYLYWQVDSFDNQLPENTLITRGMQLEPDAHGLLFGVGSGGQPVSTTDQRLTSLVHDVIHGDNRSDHVAATSDLIVLNGKILEIASVGGTGGAEVCRSTHDASPGCWRMMLSTSDSPLGVNVFGKHELPESGLPDNTIEYPRVFKDPTGHHFLLGFFGQPKTGPLAGRTPVATNGLEYIPFEPAALTH